MDDPTPNTDTSIAPANPAILPTAAAPATPTPPTTALRPGRRSELTKQVLESHYANDVDDQNRLLRRGAYWFYWVAALSLINSIISLFGGGVTFLAGLAISQIADAVAIGLGFGGPYFAIAIDLVIAFFVCGFGYLASHGSRATLIAGMILYTLDGAIFLYFGAYMPALFHAYVLYQMWHGWIAQQKLDQLRKYHEEASTSEPIRRGPIS